MPDLLAAGNAWLVQAHKASVSQTVTYRRGTESVSVAATIGQGNMSLTQAFGSGQLRRTEKDFIFVAADLVISSVTIEPAAGDMIDITEGGATNRYIVRPASENEPEFIWDESRISIRVHAKFWKAT